MTPRPKRAPAPTQLHMLMDADLLDADPSARLCQKHGTRFVLGVDEVGRGPLAGPVVTGAVVLDVGQRVEGVADSKALSAAQRMAAVEPIRAQARGVGLAEASVAEIDALGILHATLLAMRRAVLSAWRAAGQPDVVVLVDGRERITDLALPQYTVVAGDAHNQAIGAASILAKQHRDALMDALALQHPAYGFDRHKGYGTAEHLAALHAHGPSPHHRRSFEPVKGFLAHGVWPALVAAHHADPTL